jgi:MFS family permease
MDDTRRRQFRVLMTAETLSLLGDQLLGVALPLFAFDHLGGASASVLVLLTRMVPSALLGVWGGVVADRVDRRRLFLAACLLRAGLVLPLLGAPHGGLPLVLLVVVALVALAQLAGPAVGASLPSVVSPETLPSANARLTARTVLLGLAAPTLGALVYARAGLQAVVLVNVGLYLLSGAVARLLRLPAPARPEGRPGVLADLAGGVRLLTDDPVLGRLILVVSVAMLGLGVELAVVVPFVRDTLHGSSVSVGQLSTVHALGGLVGAVTVPRLVRRLDPLGLIRIGVLGLPAAAAGLLVSQQVWHAAPGMLLAGLLMTLLSTGATTHLQRAVPDTHLGRVLGVIGSTLGLASAAGAGGARLLTHLVPLRDCLAVAAGIELLGVLLWLTRSHDQEVAGARPTA